MTDPADQDASPRDGAAVSLTSLRPGYRAAVIGARGAIGGAIAAALEADQRCGGVLRLARSAERAEDRVDLLDEPSIEAAAARARAVGPLDLLFIASGGLRLARPDGGVFEPEKALSKLEPQALAAQMALNAIGPALALKHFAKAFDRRERGLIGALSARVGSIGDNRLGGWHGYRAAKAALNQLLRTSAVELRRTHPALILAALHPGTVESPLSAPFRPGGAAEPGIFGADESAARLLSVLDQLTAAESGGFFDYAGAPIPW
ncbi:MAG: SDR family NAD(P)-dependent oxidoreductase [Pseudomonadota bacterium]